MVFVPFNSAAEGSIKSSREQERGPGISQPYSLIFGKALEQITLKITLKILTLIENNLEGKKKQNSSVQK